MSAVAQAVWNRSTPLSTSAEWLRDSLAMLKRLGEFSQGWDSYDSPPIAAPALSAANELILRAAEIRALRPEIQPVSGGGLQIEWRLASTELELMISPDGRVFYMSLLPDGQ